MKFYQRINQAWRDRHGQHRKPSPQAHGNSADGASGGTGRTGTLIADDTWEPIEPKPPAIPYAGIRTGELIGYRMWWLLPSGLLSSIAHRHLWVPGVVMSGDVDRIVLAEICWTIWGGVYSFNDPGIFRFEVATLREEIMNYEVCGGREFKGCDDWDIFKETTTFVTGRVQHWGEVVEHQLGYRSQFAKIDRLDAICGRGDIEALRRRYGV